MSLLAQIAVQAGILGIVLSPQERQGLLGGLVILMFAFMNYVEIKERERASADTMEAYVTSHAPR